MRLSIWISFLAMLVLVLSGCGGGGGDSTTPVSTKPGVGSIAPEIAAKAWLNTTNSQALTLVSQRDLGKYVVLSFCRTDCPVCMNAMPVLIGLHTAYQAKATFVILTHETRAAAQQCIADHPQVVWAVGAESETYKTYEEESVPTFYLISPAGLILWTGHDANLLKAAVESTISLP